MFFDGGSLAAFIFAIAMYITVTVPAIRTVVTPVEGVDTRADQIEAMRVLSAGNTLIMVLLGGILALQGGQEWARRLEAREWAKIAAEEAKERETKKKIQ
ncbi:Shr3 amino acid permease chaperone [Multifurca ochricompacta]|uniref:Shr3 amino acid permease chaperone n=1 Tax=Multifurca ochricompacta TaxID=376703 RepID=A0AAD4M8U6_9AGAM|nr:Shr3 amino acid permease chaperone [Multifurca ochricompacta]